MKKTIENIKVKEVCSRMGDLRLSLGFKTPRMFAKNLGINYTTYLNYEKNRLPPSDVLYLLKRKYGRDVNIDRLFAHPSLLSAPQIGSPGLEYVTGPHFLDPEKGTRLIKELVFIEKNDRKRYQEIFEEILGIAEALKYEEEKKIEEPA